MFHSQEKYTGTQYTATVALLALAMIFIPLLMLLTGRNGLVSTLAACAGSMACVLMAWVSWTKYSHLTMPSIAVQRRRY